MPGSKWHLSCNVCMCGSVHVSVFCLVWECMWVCFVRCVRVHVSVFCVLFTKWSPLGDIGQAASCNFNVISHYHHYRQRLNMNIKIYRAEILVKVMHMNNIYRELQFPMWLSKNRTYKQLGTHRVIRRSQFKLVGASARSHYPDTLFPWAAMKLLVKVESMPLEGSTTHK